MKRLAIVASHVIQYQDPLFRLVASDPDIDLTVLYCSRMGAEAFHDRDMGVEVAWDVEMLHGYRHRFLRNFGFGERWFRMINPGLVPAIRRGRFDAVLFMTGWGTLTSLLGLMTCRITRTPALLFGDSSYPPPETSMASRLRAKFLRALFRLPAKFMVSGHQNAEYYKHYGADPSHFHLLPFAIDNERFAAGARFSPGERETLRARFGAKPDDVVFVFSGKLVPRKDPMTFLRALATMSHRAFGLLLGDGELRSSLEQFAREQNLRVHFAGFVNQRDLPKHYAAGEVLVLPSTYEPRGLVVNEAMAAGLMPVVSDRCGCIGDVAIDGDNALVFPAGDAEALARQLDRLIADPALRGRMTQRSREIIDRWSFSLAVEGIREALGA
jgi:glycosyltransferase involved in cell wall biosynthesis